MLEEASAFQLVEECCRELAVFEELLSHFPSGRNSAHNTMAPGVTAIFALADLCSGPLWA
jgi:hypothetical protein